MRPTAFQSMRRMSSPGAYSLCSANSIDDAGVRVGVQAGERPLDDDPRAHGHRLEQRDVQRVERQRRHAPSAA